MYIARIVSVLGLVLLAGCETAKPDLPQGPAAYTAIPATDPQPQPYRIGAFDTLAVTVYQEPDLSARDLQVDASGQITLPLIGLVKVAGRTPSEVAREVTQRLNRDYLQNGSAMVVVQNSASQKVTVEGSVTEPGVYSLQGRTTLLDALAMAKGTSRVAALDQVVVFREINGQRMGALFDVKMIQRGEAADPQILGNDQIVVGFSNLKAAWRDLLTAAPLIAIFRPFN